jgi:hypothetical protein
VSRNKFVEYERSEIIGRTSIDKKDAEKARKWNRRIDDELERRRKVWAFIPPSNMSITLFEDAGAIPSSGLVLSVPHEVGRMILLRRLGRIIEREVSVDAVVTGELEEAVEVMGLGAAV